jgi:protein-disulfide isomerase
MLTDEQLAEQIRSGLQSELAQLHPPADLLERVHGASGARAASRPRRWPVPSAGAIAVAASVLFAAVVAVVGVALLGHGRSTPAAQPRVAAASLTTLAGIPQSGTRLGDPKAPVKLVLYGDLQCPICAVLTLNTLPRFIAKDVRSGTVKIVYRSFCTATCNNGEKRIFFVQQIAAYAAGKQRLFWQFAVLFSAEQRTEGSHYVTQRYLSGLAQQVPALKLRTWRLDRRASALLKQVKADERSARAAGLVGTPTLIISGPRGKAERVIGVPTAAQLERDVARVRRHGARGGR